MKGVTGLPTFGQVAAELIAAKSPGWRSAVHRKQWATTVEKYCGPICNMPVDRIDLTAVLSVLQPIWQRIPETASRVRSRVEMILDAAKAKGWRSGENPAAWKGNLAHLLARRPKVTQPHFAAMDYREVPAFMSELRERNTTAARALEFLILTAARSGEVRDAPWQEIDLEAKVWTVPAERMKGGAEHRVPLSDRAIEILQDAESRRSGLIFPGVYVMAMNRLLPPGLTIHGFRSSFRDWAGEETAFPSEIAEAALAHTIGNAVERAYRRGDALEKRRALMDAWARHCEPVSVPANVVNLHPIKSK